jgi:integrase
MQSLLRYCEDEKQLAIERPKMRKERESPGRERWLSATEIEAVRLAATDEWWPLYAVLIYTGMRVGEAQALRWGDVRLAERTNRGPRRISPAEDRVKRPERAHPGAPCGGAGRPCGSASVRTE